MTGGGGGGVEPGGGSCKQHQSALTSFDNSSDFRQFHSYFSNKLQKNNLELIQHSLTCQKKDF